jgi:hypothetical protein
MILVFAITLPLVAIFVLMVYIPPTPMVIAYALYLYLLINWAVNDSTGRHFNELLRSVTPLGFDKTREAPDAAKIISLLEQSRRIILEQRTSWRWYRDPEASIMFSGTYRGHLICTILASASFQAGHSHQEGSLELIAVSREAVYTPPTTPSAPIPHLKNLAMPGWQIFWDIGLSPRNFPTYLNTMIDMCERENFHQFMDPTS